MLNAPSPGDGALNGCPGQGSVSISMCYLNKSAEGARLPTMAERFGKAAKTSAHRVAQRQEEDLTADAIQRVSQRTVRALEQ